MTLERAQAEVLDATRRELDGPADNTLERRLAPAAWPPDLPSGVEAPPHPWLVRI